MVYRKKNKILISIIGSLLLTHLFAELSDDQFTKFAPREKTKRNSIFNAVDAEQQTKDETLDIQPEALAPQQTLPAADEAPTEEFVAQASALTPARRKPSLLEEAETSQSILLPEQTSITLEQEEPSPSNEVQQEDFIEFYFEDTDINNLLQQISELFEVTFITDENIDPLSPEGKALKGNKISFKTHRPLTKKAAWNLFLTFLDLAGFALVPQADPGFYRVVTSATAQRAAIPTYIGTDPENLPENDQMIRYVYFVQNADTDVLFSLINELRGGLAAVSALRNIKALIISDKAYNIKNLMKIIQELDQVTMPEAMSVIKLINANAEDVKRLYDDLTKTSDGQAPTSRFTARKQPTSIYFPENARMIAEMRTNSLILLGPAAALEKIEEFITKHVDVELDQPYSPFQTYQLRYAKAETIAEIMNNVTAFGKDTPAGQMGGVRAGDKYLKPMSFTPEPTTNSVVIKGDYEDYLRALEIIKKLDEPQPQVAIEALILTINFADTKELGSQLRSKVPGANGLLGNNVNFQTSGLRLGGTPSSIVTNPPIGSTEPAGPGAERLLGNLINLVENAIAGNTVVSLGTDLYGVWGIFNIFQEITNANVVSNPFLIATNKTAAKVAISEVRRVVTSTVIAGTEDVAAQGDWDAQIALEVTPQINSDGMIVLKLKVIFENFITPITDDQTVAKQSRQLETYTIVADREVIALGGLIQDRLVESLTKVPILGDIPVLGWLFKNKRKLLQKNNLFILISTRIIEPEIAEVVGAYTQEKVEDYYHAVDLFTDWQEKRDPVYRRFFEGTPAEDSRVVEEFVFDTQGPEGASLSRTPDLIPSSQINILRGGTHYQQEPEIIEASTILSPGAVPETPATGPGSARLTTKPSRSRDARRSRSRGSKKGEA